MTLTPAVLAMLPVELSSCTVTGNEVPTATLAGGSVVMASLLAETASVNEVDVAPPKFGAEADTVYEPATVTVTLKEACPELLVATVIVVESLLKVPLDSVSVTLVPDWEMKPPVEFSSWTTVVKVVPTGTEAGGSVVKANSDAVGLPAPSEASPAMRALATGEPRPETSS